MIYDGIINKPPLEELLCHFNPNHDPQTGQFTNGPGGGSGSISSKKKIFDKFFNSNLARLGMWSSNQGPEYELAKYIYNNHKKKQNPQEPIRKTILKDRNTISKQIARDMVDDFSRWEKEDPESKSNFYIKGKKVTKQQMRQHLEKEVNKKLDTINRGYNTGEWNVNIDSKGEAHFIIDGLKEYSDAQPLYFDYDISKKKIKDWGYV